MSIMPRYVQCKKCKKVYSWNPSVGVLGCPKCGSRRYKNSPVPFPMADIVLDVLKNRDKS